MTAASASPSDINVAGLFYYPVKSFRGLASATHNVLTTGLEHDRGWMLVDAGVSPAQFVTQRELPALATLETGIGPGGSLILHQGDAQIAVALPGSNAPRLDVRVWNSELPALDAGDAAAQWLRQRLGVRQNLRLVRFAPDEKRLCSATYAGDSGAHTLFADGYPVLVCSASSLDDLNGRMAQPLPMNRFRPSLVLAGLPAWDEDFIEHIHIGPVTLKLVKPCVRCIITTTDQQSGERPSDEPLASLASFRNDAQFGGVTFGWNAIVLNGGPLAVGERAEVEYRF